MLGCLSLAGKAGPVGRILDWLLRGGFGNAAYIVPIAAFLIAVAAFVRREEAGRIFIGTTLIVVAVAGIVHLAVGTPPLTGGYRALAEAGGVFGSFLAIPMRRFIGAWAGAVACVFIGVLGTCITTKTPLRRAGVMAWQALCTLGRLVVRALTRPETPRLTLVEPADGEAERSRRRPTLSAVPDPEPPEAVRPELEPEPEQERDVGDNTTSDLGPRVTVIEQPTLALKMPKASYRLPPLTLLRPGNGKRGTTRSSDEAARVLERTLADFGVDASVSKVTRGPTVSLFEIELGPGVKVNRVVSLGNDIGYALGSPDIRIYAPIPGKSAIGIEVPNRDRDVVVLGDVVNSQEWRAQRHPLTCAIGKDIAGHTITVNLAEMPHLLIAGSTGAGKSSCLNVLIASLLLRARPEEVRMILIDPKMVELTHFDNLPHLLCPVVTHPKRASETLGWVVKEMERRYTELSLVGQRNLDLYNAAIAAGTLPKRPDESARERLPYIAVIIDELADLMMVAAREVEDAIIRIAQMARAVGIHLIVATQRPSVDVVTGLIKANIPSRIAFAVASASDSRVILDVGGAEKLVGKGDMLYLPTGTSKPKRVQGAYVSEKELADVTSFIRAQAQAQYHEDVLESQARTDDDLDDEDSLLREAMELVVRSQMGSTSMLQRRLKVGFSRAGRLMDLLERRGVVGPQEGSKARAVLVTPDELGLDG